MNRATRDKLVSGTDQRDLTTGNACWETAPLVYQKLNEDFGPFDVDLTADAQRALCPRWFGPGSPWCEDALQAAWMIGTNGYSNPPYGPFIQQILPKAQREAHQGFRSTLLLPLRVTKAFKAYVLQGASELWFCDKRLVFFEHGIPRLNEKAWREKGELRADPAVFDSIIVRYLPGRVTTTPTIGIWKVPPHVTAADLERARLRKAA